METPYPIPISPTKTRIGWIGIGVMGAAMATRLLSAGYSVAIYARSPSKALDLQSKGALLVNSASELAQTSDIVFTMVGHPSDVRQNVLEKNGLLQGLNPGGVIVDTTSSHPSLAREIFAAARAKGCWAVDAPVSGGDIGARDGKLAIFGGGDAGVVKWLSPLFEVLGKVTYVGGAGCGQSCKIANQIAIGGNLMGLSEGLVFAERAGLDVTGFVEAVRGGAAGSMAMELFGERMIKKDFRPGGFAEYMVKDLGMGVDVVEEDQRIAVLPGASLAKQLFSAMVANGDGKFGTQGLISVVQRLNGIGKVRDNGGRGGGARHDVGLDKRRQLRWQNRESTKWGVGAVEIEGTKGAARAFFFFFVQISAGVVTNEVNRIRTSLDGVLTAGEIASLNAFFLRRERVCWAQI